MKELPTPTLPLIGMLDFRAPRQVPVRKATVDTAAPVGDGTFEVLWARHQDEVREAQALRHRVFAQEMGARLRPPPVRRRVWTWTSSMTSANTCWCVPCPRMTSPPR